MNHISWHHFVVEGCPHEKEPICQSPKPNIQAQVISFLDWNILFKFGAIFYFVLLKVLSYWLQPYLMFCSLRDLFVQTNLQTIPEDMCMSRRSSRTHLVVPSSFAEKVIATCDGLASSLFISFFCCFQFSLMATDFISSSFLKLYMVMVMLYMVIERKQKSHLLDFFIRSFYFYCCGGKKCFFTPKKPHILLLM